MYAVHSVAYDDLDSYFLGFNVWSDSTCWSWDETLGLFDDLGITPVRELWRGQWEDFRIWMHEKFILGDTEGYVVRVTRAFEAEEFQQVVAKYVRKDHVQTDQHWMAKAVVPNGLKT